MLYASRISLVIFTLLFAILACDLPAITLQDSGVISTSAAQTVIAGFTLSASPETLPPVLSEPTLTLTLEPPTPTITPSQTATMIFTDTPLIPQISVSVSTNCRSGPGKIYQMEGALLVGETAQIYGREPTGRYWYIRNPDSSSGYCWVWGEYATITGSTAFLPVYTPPPTPTPTQTPTPTNTSTPVPDFEASYSSLDSCVGWWVELKVKNTGSIPFKSAGVTVKDTVTDVTLANFTDVFADNNGCLSSTTRDTLGLGKAVVISAPAFSYDPSGNKIRATIILCSEIGQSGICVTKVINFTP